MPCEKSIVMKILGSIINEDMDSLQTIFFVRPSRDRLEINRNVMKLIKWKINDVYLLLKLIVRVIFYSTISMLSVKCMGWTFRTGPFRE